MSDFTKEKIAFAVGLLAVLFTVTPLIGEVGSAGFLLFGVHLTIQLLYYVMSGLLASSVYCYGIQFAFSRSRRPFTLAGDGLFASAFAAPLLFIMLFAGTRLAAVIGILLQSETARTGFTGGLGLVSTIASVMFAYATRRTLAAKQQEVEVRQYAERGVVQLRRAEELFGASHHDLAVIEAFRAVESAAHRSAVLGKKPFDQRWFVTISNALPTAELRVEFDEFRRLRNVAAHAVEPVPAEQARRSLNTASRLLSLLSGDAM